MHKMVHDTTYTRSDVVYSAKLLLLTNSQAGSGVCNNPKSKKDGRYPLHMATPTNALSLSFLSILSAPWP